MELFSICRMAAEVVKTFNLTSSYLLLSPVSSLNSGLLKEQSRCVESLISKKFSIKFSLSKKGYSKCF